MGTIKLTELVTVGFTGSFSIWHWLIVLAVVLVLFGGGGKIPRLMKDLGSGIKQFKRGMKEEEAENDAAQSKALEDDTGTTTQSSADAAAAARSERSKKAANG